MNSRRKRRRRILALIAAAGCGSSKPAQTADGGPDVASGDTGGNTDTNADGPSEAADVVVMDSSLAKVDEFMHISARMRRIALESAVGGMAISVIGMVFAAAGHLSPVSGAIIQEVIDILAVMNALRAAFPPGVIHDL